MLILTIMVAPSWVLVLSLKFKPNTPQNNGSDLINELKFSVYLNIYYKVNVSI